MSRALERLMAWYAAQCNEEWEHAWGVKIDTLDNPGWLVKIELNETPLEHGTFRAVVIDRSENDWVRCSVERRGGGPEGSKLVTFEGAGGPRNLDEILTKFCDWAEACESTSKSPKRRRRSHGLR